MKTNFTISLLLFLLVIENFIECSKNENNQATTTFDLRKKLNTKSPYWTLYRSNVSDTPVITYFFL
jgi:hypothetical protein